MVTRATFLVDDNGKVIHHALKPRAGKTQVITAHGASIAFGTAAVIRIVLAAQSWIRIDSVGTASVTDTYMPANVPEWFTVAATDKVGVKVGTAYVDILN